jgi:hypothetical protein
MSATKKEPTVAWHLLTFAFWILIVNAVDTSTTIAVFDRNVKRKETRSIDEAHADPSAVQKEITEIDQLGRRKTWELVGPTDAFLIPILFSLTK